MERDHRIDAYDELQKTLRSFENDTDFGDVTKTLARIILERESLRCLLKSVTADIEILRLQNKSLCDRLEQHERWRQHNTREHTDAHKHLEIFKDAIAFNDLIRVKTNCTCCGLEVIRGYNHEGEPYVSTND